MGRQRQQRGVPQTALQPPPALAATCERLEAAPAYDGRALRLFASSGMQRRSGIRLQAA